MRIHRVSTVAQAFTAVRLDQRAPEADPADVLRLNGT
jgi:hypothetical protein